MLFIHKRNVKKRSLFTALTLHSSSSKKKKAVKFMFWTESDVPTKIEIYLEAWFVETFGLSP